MYILLYVFIKSNFINNGQNVYMGVILGGLSLQQLEAGFRFLARDGIWAMAVRALNPSQ